jgi:hypothetical protein
MPSPLSRARWRPPNDSSFVFFLVTVVLCLLRSSDLPSVDVSTAGTSLSIGPADVCLGVTAVLAALRLRARRVFPSPWLLGASAAFALLMVVSAIPNGGGALAAAGKPAELFALTLGAAAFLDSRERLGTLALVVVGYSTVAVFWGAIGFAGSGNRQGSFLGEHDLAAVATMALAVGLARLHAASGRLGFATILALTTGALGITLGASLASLIGLYLVVIAVLTLARARRSLRRRAVLVTLGVALAVTAGTLSLRSGELGFLQAWFGPEPDTPGQYAASWSQRLIFVYVGGRVFLDHPVLGTGWQGELPPEDYAQYLADARQRFPDQPPHYFPPADGTFIPQQAYDQVLFQLGLVGAALLVSLLALALVRAVRAGRDAPRTDLHGSLTFLPLAWLAAVAGALAGEGFYGGAPLTAAFWLTLGVVAATPIMLRSST